jgi:hypothetical protein
MRNTTRSSRPSSSAPHPTAAATAVKIAATIATQAIAYSIIEKNKVY